MTLHHLLGLLTMSGFSTLSLAQTCPSGLPRVAPESRYSIDATNGLVRDLATGLIWKRCSEGQSGESCVGIASTHNWGQALLLANDLNHAGLSDWRLPNAEELNSLVETGCFSPSINAIVFPGTESVGYWSSTAYELNPNFAWAAAFLVGGVAPIQKNGGLRVRLVRGGRLLDEFDSGDSLLLDSFE
jgi:hypothetical protein